MNTTEKILVIKLEDLSSFVMALAAMKQIRAAHPKAKITLLTTPPFSSLGKASGYFNTIDTGGEMDAMALARAIKRQKFARVYDLEQSQKSAKIHGLMWPFRPPWTGHGALRDNAPGRAQMHPLERNASLLRAAGVGPDHPLGPGDAAPPDLSWVANLPQQGASSRTRPIVVMIPGGREEVGWPPERFGELAAHFKKNGLDNVIIGPLHDAKLARAIQRYEGSARDLTGRTDYAQLAALASRAVVAVGNAGGLLDLAIAAGAPTIAFYPPGIDLMRAGPRGHVAIMQSRSLGDIQIDQVARAAINMAPELAVAS
jgi:ADP-heptose:LPS heptosyltransferase